MPRRSPVAEPGLSATLLSAPAGGTLQTARPQDAAHPGTAPATSRDPGHATQTVHDYVRERVPSAYMFESPASLMLRAARALPTLLPGDGAPPRARPPNPAEQQPDGRLAGVSLAIALGTAAAGLSGVRLASPSDVYHESTGTFAPVITFRSGEERRDAAVALAPLIAAYRHHRAHAAADSPCGHTGNAVSTALHRGGARALRCEVLRKCVESGSLGEAEADAWHAAGAAAQLPLYVRASVAAPWEPGRAGLTEEGRVQRVIEAFSEAALPALQEARDALRQQRGHGGSGLEAADVFVIPFGEAAAETDGEVGLAGARCADPSAATHA